MTYTETNSDNYHDASDRDIPQQQRNFTCDMGGGAEESFRIGLDVKTCDIINNTDQDLSVYVSLYNGVADTPSGLHTAGTSSLIDTVAAGDSFFIAQNTEFNSFHFKASSGATGSVKLRPGSGLENNLVSVETRAITAVS